MPGEIFLGIASALSIPLAWPLGRYISSGAITNTDNGSKADSLMELSKLSSVLFFGPIIAYEILTQENTQLKFLSVPIITFLGSYGYFGLSRAIRKFAQDD